jgi:hypothetical protein
MKVSLTERVLEFQRTGTGQRELVEYICADVYRHHRSYHFRDADVCADVLSRFYRRIPGLVERFTYSGTPFEFYLARSLRYFSISLAGDERAEAERQRFFKEREFWSYAADSSFFFTTNPDSRGSAGFNNQVGSRPPAGSDDTRKAVEPASTASPNRFSVAMKRRLLILGLKNCNDLTDRLISKLSLATGRPKDEILEYRDALARMLDRRLERYEFLKERRNSVYYRIRVLETLLHDETGREKRKELGERLERERRLMGEYQVKLSQCRIHPTHTEIAKVLGIPKGSVDSGMYFLRKRFESLSTVPVDRVRRTC